MDVHFRKNFKSSVWIENNKSFNEVIAEENSIGSLLLIIFQSQ